jgi:chromosome segregation ATPase
MDDIDILSSALLEMKRKMDDQEKIIEKLSLERASLTDKYEYLNQKIEQLVSLQKQSEKTLSQYMKELESLREFSKNLNKIIEDRFDELVKKLEIEKISEKARDIENVKELNQKIKQLFELKKSYDGEVYSVRKSIEDLEKRMKEVLKEKEKQHEKILSEANAKIEKIFEEKSKHLMSLIKSSEKDVSQLKEKYEKDYKLNQEKLEAAAKVDQLVNRTIKKVEDRLIEIEDFANHLKSELGSYSNQASKKDEKTEKRLQRIELSLKEINDANAEKRKEIEKEISTLIQKMSTFEKDLKSLSSSLSFLSKSPNDQSKEVAVKISGIEKEISSLFQKASSLEKELKSLYSSLSYLNKVDDEQSKEIKETFAKISEVEKQVKSLCNSLEKLSQQASSGKEYDEKLMSQLQQLDASLHDFVKEREKAVKLELSKDINTAVLELSDKISKLPQLESSLKSLNNSLKSIEADMVYLKNRNSEEIRKTARAEIVPVAAQITKDSEMIKQKIKQIETSFNVQVKTSSNFYDLLKHDLSNLKNQVESLDSMLRSEMSKRVDLEQEFNDLGSYFKRIEEGFSALKSSIDDKIKKQKDEINQLNKNMLDGEKELLRHLEDVKAMMKEYSDKQYKDLIKAIDNLSRDKNLKEERRMEKINEIVKEFSQKSALIGSKLELLSSYITKFSEMKSSFRKEILSEVRGILKDMDKKQRNVEAKFLQNDTLLNELEKRMDKLESKTQELSKEVAVWKERYKLQLGRIAEEVDLE